jgi:hypothetical protein
VVRLRHLAAYSLEAGAGLAFSQIPVMVRASRPLIRPVVPKAKGNQSGLEALAGFGTSKSTG